MFLNLKKCLDYLKQYSRIDTQYLWCTQEIFKGDANIIWGLMNTIYNSFHSEASTRIEGTCTQSSQINNSRSKSPVERITKLKDAIYKRVHSSIMQSKTSTPSTAKKLNKNLCGSIRSSSKNESVNETNSKYITPNRSTIETNNEEREDKEKLTRIWLRSLNFTTTRAQEDEPLLINPFRNGTLLCEVYLFVNYS